LTPIKVEDRARVKILEERCRSPESVVFKHILIATDGSELAERAAEQGLELAKALEAKVTTVTATEPWVAVVAGDAALAFPSKDYDEGVAEAATQLLERIVEKAKSADIPCAAVHMKDQFPAEGIIAAANENGCDLIVMASHGRRGLAKVLLGSVATRVLALSPVPVLICK
jgi:nucleotide-binding universal stress UspA family protein